MTLTGRALGYCGKGEQEVVQPVHLMSLHQRVLGDSQVG